MRLLHSLIFIQRKRAVNFSKVLNTENIDRTYLHAARLQFEFKSQSFDVFSPPKEGEWWYRQGVMSQIQKFSSILAELTEQEKCG